MAGSPYDVLGIRPEASLGEARAGWVRETRLLIDASNRGDIDATERRKLINCAYEDIKRKSALSKRKSSNPGGSQGASEADCHRGPEPKSQLQLASELAGQLYDCSGSSHARECCSASIMAQLCAGADVGILMTLADGIFRSIPDFGAEPSVQGLFCMLLLEHASIISLDHVGRLTARLVQSSVSADSRQRCSIAIRLVLNVDLAVNVVKVLVDTLMRGLPGSGHNPAVTDVFKDLLDKYPHILTSDHVKGLSESLSNSLLSSEMRSHCSLSVASILKAEVSDSVKGILADGVMRAMMDHGHVRAVRRAFNTLLEVCPDRISAESVEVLAGQLLYTGSQNRRQCTASLLSVLSAGVRGEVLFAMVSRVKKAAEMRDDEPHIQELATTLEDMLGRETKRGWRSILYQRANGKGFGTPIPV
jgi:hypothetical protein